MKARLDYVCEPAKKNSGYDEEEISLVVDLPFAPFVGMLIKPTPNSDYLRVIDVMLDLTPDGEGLILGIEEPDDFSSLRPWREMKAEGWKILE